MRTLLLAAALEPFLRTTVTRIGPEPLSLARLQREARALGASKENVQRDVYARFGFRLEHLPDVISALNVPYAVKLRGGHVMTGEEAVLITLRRFRTAGEPC